MNDERITSVWRSPWIWRGVGLVLVVIGAAMGHGNWMRSVGFALHGVPAFFAGVVLLWVVDTLVALVVLTARAATLRDEVGRMFSRRALLGGVWRCAFLGSLLVLFYTVESWRGHRVWSAVAQEAARRGEPLSGRTLSTAPVAPDQNVASAPVFAPLLADLNRETEYLEDAIRVDLGGLEDVTAWARRPMSQGPRSRGRRAAPWMDGLPTDFREWLVFWPRAEATGTPSREEVARDLNPRDAAVAVLARLEPFEGRLNQLRDYSGRPRCWFPLDYERQMWRDNHVQRVLQGFLRMLRLRASALLAVDRAAEAHADVMLALRLVDYARQQPWAIEDLSRLWSAVDAVQPVWEALRVGCWTPEQLAALQVPLAGMNLLGDYPAGVRNDALAMADLFESFLPARRGSTGIPTVMRRDIEKDFWTRWFRRLYPGGWSLQNQAAIHRFHLEVTSRSLDAGGAVFRPMVPAENLLHATTSDPLFAVFIEPKVRQMAADAAELYPAAQTAMDLAAVACALERHRVENASYPERLDALVPTSLVCVPKDVMTGEPLRYRREGSGYVLYAVGANGVDDGGASAGGLGGTSPDLGVADWAWVVNSTNPPAQAKAAFRAEED